jgi:hypothetical protein
MADNENVTIRIRVRADTKEIDRVQKKLAALCKQADDCNDTFKKLGRSFDDSSDALKRTDKSVNNTTRKLNALSGAGRMAANMFSKVFKLALIGAAIETAALAVALSSVNALLKSGAAIGKAWNSTVRGIGVASANAAAGVLTLVAAFTAAQRQFVAAQTTGRYGGSFLDASRGLRTLQSDSQLAVFGLQSLTGAFSAASKNARVTSQTVSGLRGLADFAVASGDLEKGLAAAANLVSMLQAGKASGGADVLAAAGELGPEFEKAYKSALAAGKRTNDELLKMFASGELAEAAGVKGGFAAIQGTLMGQLKIFATQFQVMFADLGGYFLEPLQDALHEVTRIFKRTFVAISGNLSAFARGPFIDVVIGATEKLSDFLALLFNEYLPKTQEVLNNFINGWKRFSSAISGSFQKFNAFLNKFSEASAEINKFFGTIFRAIGGSFSDNFGEFAKLIMDNREEFQKFGEQLGKLIKSIFDLFGEIRRLFFDSLPAINGLVAGITRIVEGFTSLLAVLRAIPGTLGSIVSIMAAGGLLAMGSKKGRGAAGAAAGKAPGMLTKLGVPAVMAGKVLPALGIGLAGASITSGVSQNLMYRKDTGAGMAASVGGYALTGAAMGGMLGGPVGVAVGAIGGAIVGGLVGWFQKNDVKKKIGEAGKGLAEAYVSELDNLIAGGYVGEAEKLMSEGEEFIRSQAARYNESAEFTSKALEALGIEGEKTQKKIDLFNRRVSDLSRITGKTQKEIIETSRSLNINLSSELVSLQSVLQETGWAVGKFGDDFNAAISNAFGQALGFLDQERLKIEVPKAVDEAFASAIASGFERTALIDFLEQATIAAQVYGEGDPLKAFDMMYQMLVEGTAFSEEGTRGYGQQAAFIAAGGQDLVTEMLGSAGVGGAIIDQILANVLSSASALGTVVDSTAIQSQLIDFMSKDPAKFLQAADILRTPGRFESAFAQGRESGPFTGMMAVDQVLQEAGFSNVATSLAETASEQMVIQERMITDVVQPFATAVEAFRYAVDNMANRLAAEVGRDEGPSGTPREDRRRNRRGRGRGDRSSPVSNLLDTVGNHSAVSSGISGKRSITSGLRNYQLGSMSSDHRFGRAIDVTGDNLGLYKSAIEASGGHAGFHGWGGNRHLHVVPNSQAIGDSTVPYMGGAGSSGSSFQSNDSYNINVYPSAGADPKEIAEEVMTRIQRSQRSARERAG